MKKSFEYKIIEVKFNDWKYKFEEEDLLKQLNKEGQDGWEISETLITGGFTKKIILKREI